MTITSPTLGVDGDYIVESIAHDLPTSEYDHTTTFTVEEVPASIDPPLRFGDTAAGFGSGKFASGLDDAERIFIFGETGNHAFGVGLWAR